MRPTTRPTREQSESSSESEEEEEEDVSPDTTPVKVKVAPKKQIKKVVEEEESEEDEEDKENAEKASNKRPTASKKTALPKGYRAGLAKTRSQEQEVNGVTKKKTKRMQNERKEYIRMMRPGQVEKMSLSKTRSGQNMAVISGHATLGSLSQEKSPSIIVRRESPYNAEPPKEALASQYITPVDSFYVRSHGDVPLIDENVYRLKVSGLVDHELSLSLEELKSNRFQQTTLVAPLQCAGNRRAELNKIASLGEELPWSEQAISNGEWKGVTLKQILDLAGVKSSADAVEFVGLDQVKKEGQTHNYGSSIELDKAKGEEVILAYEMNGKPLTHAHGYPLRVVVAGYIGARSVKWLDSITLRTGPSQNFFQQKAYKMFPPDVVADNVNWDEGIPLSEASVTSVILEPREGEEVKKGTIHVKGYACGGSRKIVRVDLSVDNGNSWKQANLGEEVTEPKNKHGWTLWNIDVRVDVTGPLQLACRSFDSAWNTQPEEVKKLWNFKGYMNNAVHKINLMVKPLIVGWTRESRPRVYIASLCVHVQTDTPNLLYPPLSLGARGYGFIHTYGPLLHCLFFCRGTPVHTFRTQSPQTLSVYRSSKDFARTMSAGEIPKIILVEDDLVEEERSIPLPVSALDRLQLKAFSEMGNPCASNQTKSSTTTEKLFGPVVPKDTNLDPVPSVCPSVRPLRGKWSFSQHMAHTCTSIQPLNIAR
ncbi:hypothetical protein PROFUN_03316 [Planoprotostelium fungivorum]|uniref:Sulfite oxidase n=1 Tax=Planoprotostelium fungivorum TaxID=1890364 RepID=A0A2P6NWR2_9EUKA|nr:hypothetical protein PROFUN_03316 [Planoprotostelium fungivorum]